MSTLKSTIGTTEESSLYSSLIKRIGTTRDQRDEHFTLLITIGLSFFVFVGSMMLIPSPIYLISYRRHTT